MPKHLCADCRLQHPYLEELPDSSSGQIPEKGDDSSEFNLERTVHVSLGSRIRNRMFYQYRRKDLAVEKAYFVVNLASRGRLSSPCLVSALSYMWCTKYDCHHSAIV